MALTQDEATRAFAAARKIFPPEQARPIPIDLASWADAAVAAFVADAVRPHGLAAPSAADFQVAAAWVGYGPPGVPVPDEAQSAALYAALGPGGQADVRSAERLLRYGVLHGWVLALETLVELIGRVIRPAVRWLHRRGFASDSRLDRDVWVDEEVAELSPLLAFWLRNGCECHREADHLSVAVAGAITRCNTEHTLAVWDGKETLARFLCRALVCEYDYYSANMDAFPVLNYCHSRLPVNAFRHGMLAKAACGSNLRAGNVLCCNMTQGCKGEIEPSTDHCSVCDKLTQADKPCNYRLWLGEQYRQADCLLCQTCGYYYFLHERPCLRQKETLHKWSANGPRRVWVRNLNFGDDAAKMEPERRASLHRRLTPQAQAEFSQAIESIPNCDVRNLAGRLLCSEPDLRQAAEHLGWDVLDQRFLARFREVLQAIGGLCPSSETLALREELLPLARQLLDGNRSLQEIARNRGTRVNNAGFRGEVFEVLTRTLSTLLHQGSHQIEAAELDWDANTPDAGLLAFIATMQTGDERDLACELFKPDAQIVLVAQGRGFELENPEFVRRLLASLRAVKSGLRFDPVARFARGELHTVAQLLFDTTLSLEEIYQELRGRNTTQPQEVVLGVLLNVYHTANGSMPETPDSETEE